MHTARDRVVPAALMLLLGALSADVGAAQTRVEFHLLPAVSTGPMDPAWSPDGRWIAFSMRGDIWKVPAGGGEAIALTGGPAYHYEPAWAPDGRRIALTVERDGNLDIGWVDADGGEVTRLTSHAAVDFDPAWTADGRAILFVTRRSESLDIYSVDLATGVASALIAGRRNEFQPAPSPDGTRLAYVAPVPGRLGSGGLWVVPIEGGEARLAHYEETSYRAAPQWTADANALVFSSDAAGSNDIAIVPAGGGNRVRLTEGGMDEFGVTTRRGDSRIAFVSNHEGPTRLYTIDLGGAPRGEWTPVTVTSRRASVPTGTLQGEVRDAAGQLVPARIMVLASDGRAYTEDGGFHRKSWSSGTHYAHSDGTFEIEVPAGDLAITATRGFEHAPASATVEVPADGTARVSLRLDRIADPADVGWVSGDTHVHDLHEGRFGLTREMFFAQVLADDLRVTNALIHMDGTKLMGRWEDLTGEPFELSAEGHLLRYSQEFRGSFGHVGLLGVRRFIMPLIGGTPNSPWSADVLKLRWLDGVREDGGIGGYVHPYNGPVSTPVEAASADIPLHVALGRGDFFDVVSIASLEGASSEMYYRMLNSGFRLAATGGTDNFSDAWLDPSGGTARTYARVDGPPSFDSWIAAVRAGRTFATSGPLLFLEVEGREPGAEIRVADTGADSFTARIELASFVPVSTVELIANGEVVASWQPAEASASFEATVALPSGGWIAARASGPPSRLVGDAFPFAHTSPIYVVRGATPYTSVADARFLLATIDELWRRVQRRDSFTTEEERRRYARGVDEARAVFQRIIDRRSR